nr:hypothetical protein L204_04123 [Cryptococcus depauperatus CBS 7855]
MSNTYPVPPKIAKPAKVPGAFRGVFTGAGHSNIFLSPVQEARILDWRAGAATPSKSHSKSAPPSAGPGTSKMSSSECTCVSDGRKGNVSPPSSSSCVAHSYKNKCRKGPNSHVKSYYSKRTGPERSLTTQDLPMSITVRPKTPPAGLRPPKFKAKSWTSSPTQSGFIPVTAQSHGLPQWTMSPIQAEAQVEPPPMPRIAGARDPISQAYWRRMFPPTVPGVLPPQAFGMPAGRLWGA